MQMTAITIKSGSGGVRGQQRGRGLKTELPLLEAEGGAEAVMKVGGGKQLENRCNLAGNVI